VRMCVSVCAPMVTSADCCTTSHQWPLFNLLKTPL